MLWLLRQDRGQRHAGSAETTASVAVVSGEGVNAEPMTDLMFSVSHPTEGAEGIIVWMIIDNSSQGAAGRSGAEEGCFS